VTRGKRDGFIVSVPWPVRLFGDAQEELGLPVISAAVGLRTAIRARPRRDALSSVSARGLPAAFLFEPKARKEALKRMPSLAKALEGLRVAGLSFDRGCDFEIHTQVSEAEDLLSSPALVVAWIVTLLILEDRISDVSGDRIATLACATLKGEQAQARTVADIRTCVLGGTLFIGGGEKPQVRPIQQALPGLVLAYPRRRRRADKAHVELIRKTRRVAANARSVFAGFDLAATPFDRVVPTLGRLSESDARILYAQLGLRDLCHEAQKMLEQEHGFDDDRIGEMFDRSRELFRDYLGCGSSQTNHLAEVALEAGALGCKLNIGSDGLLAFAPGCRDDVISAIRNAGGEAHEAVVSEGMSMEA